LELLYAHAKAQQKSTIRTALFLPYLINKRHLHGNRYANVL